MFVVKSALLSCWCSPCWLSVHTSRDEFIFVSMCGRCSTHSCQHGHPSNCGTYIFPCLQGQVKDSLRVKKSSRLMHHRRIYVYLVCEHGVCRRFQISPQCACHWPSSSCWYGLCAYYNSIYLFYVLSFRWLTCVIVLTLEVADWFWLIQEMTMEAGERTCSGVWVLMYDGLWAGTPCWLYRCSVFVEGISSALSPAIMSMSVPMCLYMVEMYRFHPRFGVTLSDRCLRSQTIAARIGDRKQMSMVYPSASLKENLAGVGINLLIQTCSARIILVMLQKSRKEQHVTRAFETGSAVHFHGLVPGFMEGKWYERR